MGTEEKHGYTIAIDKTTREVLDLLTRKRAFALVTTHREPSHEQQEALRGEGNLWGEICSPRGHDEPEDSERSYVVIGAPVASRELMLAPGTSAYTEQAGCFRELEQAGCRVTYLPIGKLYELCEGEMLRFGIVAGTEAEANKIWLREKLRLGSDPGKWYASDDFSSIKVSLRPVERDGESREPDSSEKEVAGGATKAADIAEFEVYDRLCGIFEQDAKDPECGYGDDIFVEYAVSSAEGTAHYCATEFYTNHNWNADPASLLVVRFRAEISAAGCSEDEVRFSHPSKVTKRKVDHRRFIVDSMASDNDVEVKWDIGTRGDKHPDTRVSDDRVMDNPIDLRSWIDMHRQEIVLM